LDAAALCGDDTAFVLVGDGVEKPRLVNRAKKKGLKRVFFLPSVPKRAVPTLTQWFDCSYIGALESPLYDFGLCMNKLFDSMMSGKPILCAITTPDDIVTRYQCGVMVPSGQPERVAQAIQELKTMPPEQRNAMGERGQSAARERYTYHQIAKQFAELFS